MYVPAIAGVAVAVPFDAPQVAGVVDVLTVNPFTVTVCTSVSL